MASAYERVGARKFCTHINLKHGRNTPMKELLKRLWEEEEGQDLTEYALLLVLISLVAVAAMGTLGSGISDAFSNAAANLTTAAS
jgi:pilus assembly protein Flp/PilA